MLFLPLARYSHVQNLSHLLVKIFCCILAPGDYTAVTVVLTFTPMESRVCYNVSVGNDVVYEGPEDFELVLRSNDNLINLSPDIALITILDDDGNNLYLVTIFIIMQMILRYIHTYRLYALYLLLIYTNLLN